MQKINMPCLTKEVPGTGGKIKTTIDDFRVSEIPLYTPCGEGEHLYLYIEKKGIGTFEALRQMASHFKISPKEIGYAGIKDAHAVTRQYFSFPQGVEKSLEAFSSPSLEVLEAKRHTNKLKTGHLSGNRFEILIREATGGENISSILETLQRTGVPNYYGEQRFGTQGNTGDVGRALLVGDHAEVLRILFGEATAMDTPLMAEVKALFQQGKYQEAFQRTPYAMSVEKGILKSLSMGDNPKNAVRRIPQNMQHFYVSAYQSFLFNQTLAMRIDNLDRLWKGDIAIKHPGHSVFLVEDEEKEQPRCASFEISPTGPLFGYKMLEASGKQGETERQVLEREKMELSRFRRFRLKGERRTYRFPLSELSHKRVPEGILLSFSLPRGCYATAVLREIMKTDVQDDFVSQEEEQE